MGFLSRAYFPFSLSFLFFSVFSSHCDAGAVSSDLLIGGEDREGEEEEEEDGVEDDDGGPASLGSGSMEVAAEVTPPHPSLGHTFCPTKNK